MTGLRARWSVLVALLLLLACTRAHSLRDGPPAIDRRTTVLGTFDPGQLIISSGGGLDLQTVPRAELPAPALLEWGPIGDTDPGTGIQLRFNRPMIPLGERPRVEPGTFTIEPPVDGELEWEDPTRLVFRPHQPLPIATTFTVRVAARIPTSDARALELARSWQFTTTRPQVAMKLVDDRPRWARSHDRHHRSRVQLTASQPLRREVLLEHLHAAALDEATRTSTPVAIEVRELDGQNDGRSRFEVRPRDRWPAGRVIVLTVDAALTGEAGPASMAHDFVYSFPIAEGVSIDAPICVESKHLDGCELGPVALEPSEPIDAHQARHVRVHPEPAGFGVVATDELEQRGPRGQRMYEHLLLWGDFQLGVDYTLTVDAALHDMHGQALTGERSFDLRFVEPAPSLEVDALDRSLDLAGPATIGVESRHVEELELTLAILTDAEHERLLDYDYPELGFPTDLAEIQRQRIKLAHTGSYGWSAHALDLSNFTQRKPGVVVFELRAGALTQQAQGRAPPPRRFGLVQLTRLGVTVVGAVTGGFVRVARLQDDTPVANASVELIDAPNGERTLLGHTDADGRLALPSSAELGEQALLRVRSGDDRVLIEIGELADYNHRERDPALRAWESVHTALLTERPLYRPGEPLHVLGWAAIASPYELLGLRPLPEQTKVELRVRDPHGTLVARRTVVTKQHGKFWASFELPTVGALGRHTVDATILGETERLRFSVKDIQPPDFELAASARTTDIGPGQRPQITVTGSYLFGGSVPIERVWHSTECHRAWYRPPGLPDGFELVGNSSEPGEPFPSDELTAASRRVRYTLEPAPTISLPLACTHLVTATDANARNRDTSLDFLVHPPFYLAVHTPDELEPDEQVPIDVRALLPDGSAAALEDVELTLSHGDAEQDESRSRPQRCRAKGVDGHAQCWFRTRGADYHELEIRARVDGRELVTYDWLYVGEPELPADPVEDAELTITSANTDVRVGETAKLLVQAPWSSGRALVLLGKTGIHGVHELRIDDGRGELELEVADAWIPDVDVYVLAIEPSVPPRLHWDQLSLYVDPASRHLAVTLRAPNEAATRQQIPIDVEVRDLAGNPVSGHVAVWAIDESLLALAPLELPSIVDIFAPETGWHPDVDFRDRYDNQLAPYQPRPDPYSPRAFDPSWMRSVIGLGGSGLIGQGRAAGAQVAPSDLAPMNMRSNFSSAPFFIADAALDESGHAHVLGTLPDNLTTYRIVALASAPLPGTNIEARAGTAEARVRVTRPLVVRAVLPRILRPGDRAELGVVVDNLAGPDGVLELEVALLGGEGAAALLGATRTRVSMPAGAQIHLPFEVQAGGVGEPMFEVQARLLDRDTLVVHARDGVRVQLPIEPEPTATERVAVYGSSMEDVALLPLALPADVDPRHGGLSVSIGKSLLGELEDAVAYLVEAPHDGAEQAASRILAVASFTNRDDIPLGVSNPTQHVAANLDQLLALQRPDGGFAPYPHARESSPRASAWVTVVLGRANRAGFVLPDHMLLDVYDYLHAELERWLAVPGPALAQDIEAALLLRSLADIGNPPPAAIQVLFERRARLPLFARANLLLAILDDDETEQRAERIDTLVTELLAHVEEPAGRARVVGQTGPWVEFWDSDARTSALVLNALVRARPDHVLVLKLARGLLDARQRGRWANTQENAFALLALLEYAAVHEPGVGWLQGRVWLGNSTLAHLEITDESPALVQDFTPMAELLAASSRDVNALILERDGWGRMYYRIGLDWASTNIDRPAASAGLELHRQLRTAAGPLGEGDSIELGSSLALDITIKAEQALDDLAIEIPIPGGLEAIQTDLRQTVARQLGGQQGGWVCHQELHRDRVVLLAEHLEPGVHSTTVFLRAILAGDYRMPAASAEMIYYPEVYARTTARRVVIR